MYEVLIAALGPLRGFCTPWYVAGGWAIDLFAERVTREHSDVDLMVARSDQEVVSRHFRDRALAKVMPHPDGLVGQGTVEPWGGERLDLPVHQVFADDAAGNRIEILFGEIEG
ncbi:MAG: nucleotidyltransferase domain-containing protein, partial [Acidimicrobiia bacterium]